MKINSNTVQLLKDSQEYQELEKVLSKIASDNKIDGVESIQIKLSSDSGVLGFKFAIDSVRSPEGIDPAGPNEPNFQETNPPTTNYAGEAGTTSPIENDPLNPEQGSDIRPGIGKETAAPTGISSTPGEETKPGMSIEKPRTDEFGNLVDEFDDPIEEIKPGMYGLDEESAKALNDLKPKQPETPEEIAKAKQETTDFIAALEKAQPLDAEPTTQGEGNEKF